MQLQQTIAKAKAKEAEENKKQEEAQVVEIVQVEPENSLPTTYVSANQLKLSAKELTHKVSYLDRLKNEDERYEKLKITTDKANKIRRQLTRLTTGTASVVPLRCNGPECSFKNTCLVGDTKVLLKGGESQKISELVPGLSLYSFNVLTRRIESDTIVAVAHMGQKLVYKISTKYGNSIEATADHPFLTETVTSLLVWDSIDNTLKVGDTLIVDDFDSRFGDESYAIGDCYSDVIISIEEVGIKDVYDITVRNNENFIANNIVVHNCPYFLENVAPVGLACLVETQLIEYWLEKYQSEFNIDDGSITDMHMIARLCEYDIYDMRVTRYLAENDQTLLTDFISSFDDDGNPISNKATSAAFEVKERIDRMRSKTLKELMATREAKAKVLSTVANTTNTLNLASLKQKYDELIKEKATIKTVNE